MTARFELRARYIEGWYELDAEKLVSAASSDFIFDDPAEALPVNRESLAQYMVGGMHELDYWVRQMNGAFQTRFARITMGS